MALQGMWGGVHFEAEMVRMRGVVGPWLRKLKVVLGPQVCHPPAAAAAALRNEGTLPCLAIETYPVVCKF